MPHADSTAESRGTITRSRSSWRAISVTCSPAAPPNESMAKRLGSTPRRTETSRMPSAMCGVDDAVDALGSGHAIDAELVGDAIDGRLGGAAIERAIGRRGSCPGRESRARGWRPSRSPRRRHGRSRPGPACAPALSGPTWSMPLASTRAIEPPPAPMLAMSRLCSADALAGDAPVDAMRRARRRPPARCRSRCRPCRTGSDRRIPSSRAAYGCRRRRRPGPRARRRPPAGTASAIGATPPCDWMISIGPRYPASRSRARAGSDSATAPGRHRR